MPNVPKPVDSSSTTVRLPLWQRLLKDYAFAAALGLTLGLLLAWGVLNFQPGLRPAWLQQTLSHTLGETYESQALVEQVWQLIEHDYHWPLLQPHTTEHHTQWQHWRKHYNSHIKTKADAYHAIEAMLLTLQDPYTHFLPPFQFTEQQMGIQKQLVGIGLQLFMNGTKATVLEVIPNSPAQKTQKFRPLDVVTHVNGVSVETLPLQEIVKKIRGEAGTQVRLRVTHAPKQGQTTTTSEDILVIRQAIALKNTTVRWLNEPKGVAYLGISSFLGEGLNQEVEEQLKPFLPKLQGLIIDLRGNPGGLLQNAVELADTFLEEGRIVSIHAHRSSYSAVFNAQGGQLTAKPVVLLLDGGSASASEVFAAALQAHHRAKVVGQQSFGKGLVQRVVNLSNTEALNLTIAEYHTPKDISIHKKGVSPDVPVPAPAHPVGLGSPEDATLQRAIGLMP